MKEYWSVRVGQDWLASGLSGIPQRVRKFQRAAWERKRAYQMAGEWGPPARVVHVTCKPKAVPPLKVGDEVLVRGKVTRIDASGRVLVKAPRAGSLEFWAYPEDVAR